jgi:hypothetical protein
MTGRIKLLKNNTPVMGSDEPPLEYLYDELGEFDKQCGTWGLDAFQLPNLECPETFVCLDDVTDPSLVTYAECIDAMDCHMMAGMTTKISANSPVALVRVSVPVVYLLRYKYNPLILCCTIRQIRFTNSSYTR